LKEAEFTGKRITQIKDPRQTKINTPSARVGIVDEAKKRYREATGKELSVEQLLAFYIDRRTSKKYELYQYNENVKPDPVTREGDKIIAAASKRCQEMDEVLHKLGINRGESGNIVIVKDPTTSDGYNIRLIDTEMWEITD